MPRKNKNARSGPRQKRLREKKPRAYLVDVNAATAENMSPGKLVAAAEYRVVEGYYGN